jgi:enoyl-CoA hydratase/carnithine racemase
MTHELLVEQTGVCGWITLQRPKALNALSMAMVQGLHEALTRFEQDPHIFAIVMDSMCDKAFCAGGDIKAAYEHRNQPDYLNDYFEREYDLNRRIGALKKPYIALIDGMCFGGGMGLACHGSHRIMTPSAFMGMPETAIGFYPDVGAGYFYNQMPGLTGRYLGLTGQSFTLDDALFLGLATHGLPHEKLDELRSFLKALACGSISEFSKSLELWLGQNAYSPLTGPVQENLLQINHCFSPHTMEDIIQLLSESSQDRFCQKTLETLHLRSPTSLKVTLRHLSATQGLSRVEALQHDLRLSLKLCAGGEFFEGIRAMVVDKDKNPMWHPSKLADVRDDWVESLVLDQEDRSQKSFG